MPTDYSSPERQARRTIALGQLRQWGDPALHAVARPIDRFDGALADLAARMADLMDEAIGVGLAAPQVGSLQRLFVYRFQERGPLGVLVNPVLLAHGSETQTLEEGCLSIADVHVPVERPSEVRIAGVDVRGHAIEVEACGPDATVLQHELDHLDGVLMLDRTSPEHRRAALRELARR
jgi:peptide deformylase